MNSDHRAPGRQSVLLSALTLIDIGFFLSLVSVFLAWLFNPFRLELEPIIRLTINWGVKPFVGLAIFLALHLVVRRFVNDGGLWRKRWFQGMTLVTATTVLSLLLIEAVLAYVPLKAYEAPPLVLKGQGGNTTGMENVDTIVKDSEVRWRYLPGGTFWGLEVNNLGYLDRQVSEEKPPGMVRVICMGDSVTSQAPPPYSRYLHDRLVADPPDNRQWEAFNMGVVGYSSVQGLRIFLRQGKFLAPDFVTLYFGWNDHWKCGFKPDSDLMAVQLHGWQLELFQGLNGRRLGKLVLNGWEAWRKRPHSKEREGVNSWELNRVPPEEYVSTLKQFIEEIKSAGAVPILITAPRAATLTGELVHTKQAVSIDQANNEHDRYVELTRRAAEEYGAELLDLAAEMQGPDYADLFTGDGIHLTYPGLEFVAAAIDGKLRSLVAGR